MCVRLKQIKMHASNGRHASRGLHGSEPLLLSYTPINTHIFFLLLKLLITCLKNKSGVKIDFHKTNFNVNSLFLKGNCIF